MLRAKFDHPELEVLDADSLFSPAFFTPSIIPGSALAERIFNDPHSWDETEGDDSDLPVDVDESEDPLSWLVEEIEKFKATTAPDPIDLPTAPLDEKETFSLLLPPESSRESITSLKGIARRSAVRPISLAALFERPSDDFTKEIQGQLSKILDSGGIAHQIRAFPSSANTTAASSTTGTPSTADTAFTGSTLHTPFPPPLSAVSMATSDADAPVVHSASATLSFLEWYGIYPDSPGQEVTRKLSMVKRKKTLSSKHKPTSPAASARPSSMKPHTPVVATPLKQVSSTTPEPEEVKPPAPTPPEGSRPSTPPGLTRPQGARVSPKASMTTLKSSSPSPTRKESSPPPAAIPESTSLPRRTPSPPKERLPLLPAVDTTPLPMLLRKPSVDQSSASTPIRRLPSLPPSRSSTPMTQAAGTPTPQTQPQPLPRANSPSPAALPALPSSLPTPPTASPALTTSSFGMAPLSAQQAPPPHSSRTSVRSPLGGPVGPRTRASTRANSTSRTSREAYAQRVLSASAMPAQPPGLRL